MEMMVVDAQKPTAAVIFSVSETKLDVSDVLYLSLHLERVS